MEWILLALVIIYLIYWCATHLLAAGIIIALIVVAYFVIKKISASKPKTEETPPQMDERDRFNFRMDENGWYVCFDNVAGITVKWPLNRFNDKQEVDVPEDCTSATYVARALREMADWLYDHHKEVL